MKQHRIHTYVDSDRTRHNYCQICGQEEPLLSMITDCEGYRRLWDEVTPKSKSDFEKNFNKIFGSKD